ncbi:phosphatase PAP2 family protein [Aliarcobacter cryaerophilus]|uniref:phosphatase PAP2 family protein n=1 Tax=Aliarcobacter cryaerophilus TaxID=28198 RepID=UPI000825DF0A|nr:phosphatase PAP2 family protein [Aliarcobacter cryaerophilus]
MTQENLNKQILITTILLIVVISIFELTNLDILIQSFFYNFETKRWLVDKNEPLLKFLLYDGLKMAIIIFNIFILIALIFFSKTNFVKEYKKGLVIVLLSTIFVPSIIGGLKAITNTPCPCNIKYFGGTYPNIKVFDSYPKDFVQTSKAKCWPAGHASCGFALMSLFFLFKKSKSKRVALILAIILAWSMGSYKMLLGDHFLSHTIITMLIAWIIILTIAKFINFNSGFLIFAKKLSSKKT